MGKVFNGTFKTTYDDKSIEALWMDLENETMIENDAGELCLHEDYSFFKAGTTQEEIWQWFNKNHSKGIQYLMYEFEG